MIDRVRKSQDPQDELDYRANFIGHCIRYREENTAYGLGAVVEPLATTGFQYRATTAGRTSKSEPRWPVIVGQTVKDGSVVWTCEQPDGASLQRTLSSTTWTGTGLTIGTPADASTESVALISGGTLGQTYEVTIRGVFSDGTDKVIVFDLAIERPRTVS